MKKIILDTNFLMIPARFKIDIFSEIDRVCNFRYSLSIMDRTVDELNGIIKQQRGKYKLQAKLALSLIQHKKIREIRTKEGNVDDLILQILTKDHILATQDALLRKKAIDRGCKVILMRAKSHLELV